MRVEVKGLTDFLKMAGKVVVTVSVVDGRMYCAWGEEWKGWKTCIRMTRLFTGAGEPFHRVFMELCSTNHLLPNA